MKKFLIVCFTALALTGCGNDDDRTVTPTPSSPIIGSWKLSTYTNNGTPETLNDCRKQSTITFRDEQKAFTVTDYAYLQSVCTSSSFDGTWVNTAGNAYTITTQGGTQDLEITVSGNTLSITFNDGTEANPYYAVSAYTKI
ncbi:hypothetical protein Q765_08095 [Flavobacterium rivuli WB 3.3-2 = DSM 21788]|uniref:Lipocalin-like domain-containing protein n=1 Tax=Flavobacterium rivuli WB 3.3-2 = DSM 21788 TaxID=1121895 RepID=A0A0A2MF33_9FLAO|nr:lipocalin family protein [Flavobacterium rivuli]KGO86920.1 hypothetical protein Q765_08095 [Flavobacterium rivuli WB 3.3-2 = DSM 21788]